MFQLNKLIKRPVAVHNGTKRCVPRCPGASLLSGVSHKWTVLLLEVRLSPAHSDCAVAPGRAAETTTRRAPGSPRGLRMGMPRGHPGWGQDGDASFVRGGDQCHFGWAPTHHLLGPVQPGTEWTTLPGGAGQPPGALGSRPPLTGHWRPSWTQAGRWQWDMGLRKA